MKKTILGALLLLLLLTVMCCQGCGLSLDKIPNINFETFSAEIVVPGGSSTLTATSGDIKDGVLTVKEIHSKKVYPGGQVTYDITGFERAAE